MQHSQIMDSRMSANLLRNDPGIREKSAFCFSGLGVFLFFLFFFCFLPMCEAAAMVKKINAIVSSATEQYPGILLAPPSIQGRIKTSSGKEFLRVKFRIWPGRGAPLETNFKEEVVQSLKEIFPPYADWMVTVNYEVEEK